MPAFLVVVLALIALSVYLYLCALAFVYVTFPGLLIGLGAGFAGGAVIGLVILFIVLFGEQDERVLTPGDVAAGKLKILRTPTAIRPDFAWPGYFVVQVWLDGWVALERTGRILTSAWARIWSYARASGLYGLACWPLLLPIAAALVGVIGGLAAAGVVVGVLLAVVTTVALILGALIVLTLRVLDGAARVVRRSSGNCPRCYQVSSLPVYRCTGPHGGAETALHHDIRPGLLGLFFRRCGCGRRLPTMVLRAARSMPALCPLCGAGLHSGAGAATDVRVPVFGAPSSGKTHLIMASVVGLLHRDDGIDVTLADKHSERTYDTFESVIRSGGSAAKTEASRQPIAVTLRMRQGKREALVHVYDAAGEALGNPDLNEKFHYLDGARTLAFVLDPFAIREIRQQYQHSFADLFRAANVSADDPEPSYQEVVKRLRQFGVRTEQNRLAFVVSKRDLVEQLPDLGGLTDHPDAIRRWLIERGMDNLVASVERDFGTVRYFFVSAKDSPTADDGPLRPFSWLLEDEPVPKAIPKQTNGGRAAAQYNRT